ncbi:MAG: hypothetical protein M3017_00150 [Actinomycetota bacterium]|nr:hypothetical protein [Actinomycetota bacterium]
MNEKSEKHPEQDSHLADRALNGERRRGTNGAPPPERPRWVKVFGIVILVLVVIFVGAHLVERAMGVGMGH